MASTNKTTNYELSQYIGSDKPTYLGDYNSDMSKIDTAMHTNASNITVNAGNITATDNKIGSLSNLTTTNKSDVVSAINEVDSNCDSNATSIGTLANLNTINKSTIVNAINEVLANILNFNLTSYKQFDNSEVSMINGNLVSQYISLSKNSDGSLCKLYGSFTVNTPTNQSVSGKLTITNTGLTPTDEFTVSTLGINVTNESGNVIGVYSCNPVFKTDGTIEILTGNLRANRTYTFYLHPSLIYVKNFGDSDNQ